MGIQINGQTDVISAADGSLLIEGADLTNLVNVNISGVGTIATIKVGTAQTLDASGINVTGVITATSFSGSGANVSGVSTFGNTVVGGGTTQLVVTGNARITGILTIGTSSITLDGSNNQVNVGTGVTLHHTNGVQVGGNTLHSTVLTVNQINASGVITATSFSGSGANLTGVAATSNISTNAIVNSGVTTVAAGSAAAPSITPTGDSNTGIFFPSADTIAFGEGGAEAARIDSSGRLLLGTTSNRGNWFNTTGADPLVQLESSGATRLSITRNDYSSDAGELLFGNSRSVGYAGLLNNDNLGRISFQGADGSEMVAGASIEAFVDATPGANDMPGRLVFSTTADGASNPTERLRIDSKGHLGVNGAAPSDQFLLVNMNSGSTETAGIAVTVYPTAFPGTSNQKAGYFYNASFSYSGGFSSGVYAESNNPSYGHSYAVYAKSAGYTYGEAAALYAITNHPNPGGPGSNYGAIIKTTASATPSPLGAIYGLYIENNAGAGTVSQSTGLQVNTASGPSSVIPIIAYHASSQIFQVKSNGGINNYSGNNTNLSDERKKKNIETLDSTWSCLKNWELKKFHFKDQNDTENKHYGVIAQQIQPHCPEVISEWVEQEEKPEGHDIDGNVVQEAQEKISWLSIQEQKMMWMSIKALQEAQVRIEQLEAKVAALESA